MALLDQHQADRVRQLIGGHGEDCGRGRGPIQAKRVADLLVDRGGDRLNRGAPRPQQGLCRLLRWDRL
jgi:hypothetical protein